MDSAASSSNDERTREFLKLLGQHERRLRGFILALVPNWADAEDIAQEVRIRLWEQFDGYDRAKDFGAWARTIARYQVLTHRTRSLAKDGDLDSELMERIANQAAAMSEELEAGQKALADCFEKLPAEKRELLTRYYSGKYTTRRAGGPTRADLRRHAADDPADAIVRCGTVWRKRCTRKTTHERSAADLTTPSGARCTSWPTPAGGHDRVEQSQRLHELVGADDESLAHYIRFMCDSATLGQWGSDPGTSLGGPIAGARRPKRVRRPAAGGYRWRRPAFPAAPPAPFGRSFSRILHPLAAVAGSAVFCYALSARCCSPPAHRVRWPGNRGRDVPAHGSPCRGWRSPTPCSTGTWPASPRP